jgi:hypothetical protein
MGGREKRERKERKKRETESHHTSTLLQVMFVLEHLGQVWATFFRYATHDIAIMAGDEGMWGMFAAWPYTR